MADAGQWYKQLPRFTRYWLTATVVMSLLARFGILPLYHLYLSRELVLTNFHLWRCITSLFTYPLSPSTGFHFLINCYFITQYSTRLEKDQFGRSPADYLFLQLIIASLAVVGGLLFSVGFLMDLLVVAVTYIWCQLNKEVIVNFWFGSRFKAIYLPWVLAGMELIFQGYGIGSHKYVFKYIISTCVFKFLFISFFYLNTSHYSKSYYFPFSQSSHL